MRQRLRTLSTLLHKRKAWVESPPTRKTGAFARTVQLQMDNGTSNKIHRKL